MAIDDYFESKEKYENNKEKYKTLISQCTYRQYTTGFFFGKPDETTQIYDNNVYERDYVYLGIVGDKMGENEYALEQKNKFCVGDRIEVMKPDGRDIQTTVVSIKDEDGTEMESCPHPKQRLLIQLGVGKRRYPSCKGIKYLSFACAMCRQHWSFACETLFLYEYRHRATD